MRWLLALVLVVLAACGGPDGRAKERTAQLATCADAVERAGAAAPGDQATALASGCRPACAGLADWLEARQGGARAGPTPSPAARLIAGCFPACARRLDGTATATPVDWAATTAQCGAEALHLPADQPQLASEDWLVLTAVARWLDGSVRAGVSDRQVASRVEHVSERAVFRLPLQAHAGLPATRHRRAPRAAQFLTIGPGEELRAGTLPHARLRGGRVELLAVPGPPPGQRVVLDELGGAVVQHAAMFAQVVGSPPPETPLVLARADAPLSRLLAVVMRGGASEVEIAVAGPTTAAHPVVLQRLTTQAATPTIEIGVDGIAVRGFGDDRVTDRDHLAAELDHFAAINAPVRALELLAHPDATVADLAFIMDAAWGARVEALLFAPP